MELTRDEDDFEAFKQSLREIRDGGDSEVADIQAVLWIQSRKKRIPIDFILTYDIF